MIEFIQQNPGKTTLMVIVFLWLTIGTIDTYLNHDYYMELYKKVFKF